MKKIAPILLFFTLFSCSNSKDLKEENTLQKNKICDQYRVWVELFDIRNGDTLLSNSWNPGYNGWDVGKPIPDSIIVTVSIETSPLDFENNRPFDFNIDLTMKIKGSQSWDCMNPKNAIISPPIKLIEKKKISSQNFFSGKQIFENLKPVKYSSLIKTKDIINPVIENYENLEQIFILNSLIFDIKLSSVNDSLNTCIIEHEHRVCLESSKTIFDFKE